MARFSDSLWPTVDTEVATGLFAAADPWFLFSYVVGLVVLMTFSWHRLFTEHYFDIGATQDKILRLLPPGDLRGSLSLLRAFAIYVLLIGGLYTLFSFAGAFVWKVIEMFRLGDLAGQTSILDSVRMEDPAWPLGVSLAFVGVFNHIPKLDQIERTIRRWAHHSIGIPPYIRQLTQNVMRTPLTAQNVDEVNPRHADNERFEGIVAAIDDAADATAIRTRLDRIAVLEAYVLADQVEWPSARVTARFDRMLSEMRSDVADLFDDVDGACLLLEDIAALPDTERDPRKQDQARRKCNELALKSKAVHKDLSSLVAVFAENEPHVPHESGEMLKTFVAKVLDRSETTNWIMDKLLWILLVLGSIVFSATWVATTFGLNSRVNPFEALGTAAYHTVLMTLIYLPATLVGLSIQQSLWDKGRWRRWNKNGGRGTYPTGQYFWIFVSAYIPCLIAVLAFYFVYFVATIPTQSRAFELFLQFGPMYFCFSILGGLQGVFSAYAFGETRGETEATWRVPVLHAGLVLGILCIFYQSFSELLGSGIVENAYLILQSTFVACAATYLSAAGDPREAQTPGLTGLNVESL